MSKKLQYMILGAGLTLFVMASTLTLLLRSASAETAALPNVDKPIQSEQQEEKLVVGNKDVNQETGGNSFATLPEQAVPAELSDYVTMSESNSPSLPGAVDEDVNIIIQTVAEFAQKQENNLLGKSGWIHVVAQPYVPEEQRGSNSLYVGSTGEVISRDKLVPDSARFETWYRVNETGIYNEAISLVISPNGVIHQQSVLVGNQWLNLTLKARGVTQSEYSANNPSNEIALPVVTAVNILNDMSTWENVNLQAQVENSVYVVSADQTFEDPLEDAILAERVLAGKQIFTFDATTGQLLMTESHLQLDDGTWILRERWTYSTTEFDSELPVAVAEIFSDSMGMVEEK